VVVRVRQVEIPETFADSAFPHNPAARAAFHHWLHALWTEKDAQIAQLLPLSRGMAR
jgi:hypothetical protein